MGIIKTLTIINNYPTQYLFFSSPYDCQFGHAATPESECKCEIYTKTQLWNMNKMVLARRGPKMPKGWALIYGCSIAISPYQILLIGGHYTMMGSSQTSFIPINKDWSEKNETDIFAYSSRTIIGTIKHYTNFKNIGS